MHSTGLEGIDRGVGEEVDEEVNEESMKRSMKGVDEEVDGGVGSSGDIHCGQQAGFEARRESSEPFLVVGQAG